MGNSGAKSNSIIIVIVASGVLIKFIMLFQLNLLFYDIVHIESIQLFSMYMDWQSCFWKVSIN